MADSHRDRHDVRAEPVTRVVYYVGRGAQLIGMWLLLVDIVTAGPMGPSPRLFAVGVAVFLGGWGLVRLTR